MGERGYQIRIVKLCEDDGGGYLAMVPELPGCMSDGESYEEALVNIQDAIEDWIKTAENRGQKVPEPYIFHESDNYSGKFLVRIPKELHKELSESAEAQGISLNQLVLYYLSKQAGLEEAKKQGSTVELIEKEPLYQKNIINFFSVNWGDWKKQQEQILPFLSFERGVAVWQK